MLMTRPSMWFGTIDCRSEPVLMLNSRPRPDASAHSTSASGREYVNAIAVVSRPDAMSEPRATFPNDQRFRSGPARRPSAKAPAPAAAKNSPTSVSVAASSRFANSTICTQVVVAMTLIIAIISEMFRNTGCRST